MDVADWAGQEQESCPSKAIKPTNPHVFFSYHAFLKITPMCAVRLESKELYQGHRYSITASGQLCLCNI